MFFEFKARRSIVLATVASIAFVAGLWVAVEIKTAREKAEFDKAIERLELAFPEND